MWIRTKRGPPVLQFLLKIKVNCSSICCFVTFYYWKWLLKLATFQNSRRNLDWYSLLFIRQNYNFDMSAMIWHEIVSWFLKIYQDLKRFETQEHRIVFVLIFRWVEQVYVPSMQEQSKTGKKSEINIQTFITRYRSVWYLFSCIRYRISAYSFRPWIVSSLEEFPHLYVLLSKVTVHNVKFKKE